MRGNWSGNSYFIYVGNEPLRHHYEDEGEAVRQADNYRAAHPGVRVKVMDYFGADVPMRRRQTKGR